MAVIEHFEVFGDYVVQNEDKYGPDLVRWKGFHPVAYIEVAERSHWKQGSWPIKFDPVNLEERKLHLWKLSLPTEYWIVSGDRKHALIVPDYVVKQFGFLEEVSNSKVKSGEKFLRIPLQECILIKLEKLENA